MLYTAVDQSGNESAISESVSVHVYTPTIQAPSRYVYDQHLTVTGTALAESAVEIFNNGSSALTTPVDSEGFYYADLILAEGENALSAKATDDHGNISKMSASVAVTCNSHPPTPTGLTATVSDHDCLLTWDPVAADDLAGYNLSGTVKGEPIFGHLFRSRLCFCKLFRCMSCVRFRSFHGLVIRR